MSDNLDTDYFDWCYLAPVLGLEWGLCLWPWAWIANFLIGLSLLDCKLPYYIIPRFRPLISLTGLLRHASSLRRLLSTHLPFPWFTAPLLSFILIWFGPASTLHSWPSRPPFIWRLISSFLLTSLSIPTRQGREDSSINHSCKVFRSVCIVYRSQPILIH